jgi:lysyl-tRNA synthetase class II
MEDTNSLIEQRRAKLAALAAKGINPFMNKVGLRELTGCGDARAKFEKGELAENAPVAIAGRISAHRDMGKSQFIDLKDVTGRIQVYAQKGALGDEQFEIFKHLDLADFIGVKGTMFKTRAGEISVKAESFTVLAKALRPPPDKWDGLADTEVCYRQRYLDLIANDEVKQTFLKRSQIIREIRAFFHERGYVEVETPMMQAIPGGAAAQPFKTYHNSLGCEFYLRIALELYLKRLLVGGVDKVFEIGRNFRNEGLSRKHNPEFTMLEAYEAYGDYETMMETVESLVKRVAERAVGTLRIVHPRSLEVMSAIRSAQEAVKVEALPAKIREHFEGKFAEAEAFLDEFNHDFSNPPSPPYKKAQTAFGIVEHLYRLLELNYFGKWAIIPAPDDPEKVLLDRLERLRERLNDLRNERVIDLSSWSQRRYKDLVREKVAARTEGAVADWFALSPTERRRVAIEDLKLSGDIADGYEDFEVTGAVFEKLVEPTLIQPTFVTHLPKELVPLAKLSPDDPTTVEVFECCINGQEISPGYSEQNDPVAQRAALEHQAGGEQQKLDEDFLTALEHGMPPAGGIGIGIDRLCMMLLGQESIRDVILFPQLKPKS